MKTEAMFKPWLRIPFLFKLTKMYKPSLKHQEGVTKFLESLIDPLEKKYQLGTLEVQEKPNFLDKMYEIRETMTFDEVRQAVFVFLIGMYDTTGVSISGILLQLAMNQAEQEKVVAEINSFVSSEDDELDDECINKMKYLDLVIKESMRRIPAGLNMSRQTRGEVKLSKRNRYCYFLRYLYFFLLS